MKADPETGRGHPRHLRSLVRIQCNVLYFPGVRLENQLNETFAFWSSYFYPGTIGL
jgi:hypothetical protein